jgi:hypothetical protein
MDNALPELKKSDVLVMVCKDGKRSRVTVRKVGRGKEFDESVYFLRGPYGGKLKTPYTGEDLATMGFTLARQSTPSNQPGTTESTATTLPSQPATP